MAGVIRGERGTFIRMLIKSMTPALVLNIKKNILNTLQRPIIWSHD
jgi:hypothetical protein